MRSRHHLRLRIFSTNLKSFSIVKFLKSLNVLKVCFQFQQVEEVKKVTKVEPSPLGRYSSQLQLSQNPIMLVSQSEKLWYFQSLDCSEFLHQVRGPKSKNSDRARFCEKNLGVEILGVLCPENDPFGYCSNTRHWIGLKISQKIALTKTFRTMQVTPAPKIQFSLQGSHSFVMTSSMVIPQGQKVEKKFFAFFLRIEVF